MTVGVRGRRDPFTLTPALSHRGRGGLSGVLCFSLGSRLRGNDGGSAPFTLTLALSHRGRGDLIGVLCFSLGSRLRGNDGVVREKDGRGFTLTPGLNRRLGGLKLNPDARHFVPPCQRTGAPHLRDNLRTIIDRDRTPSSKHTP